MSSGLNFYTNNSFKIPKRLRAKDHVFNCIAWNRFNNSEATTQPILIGTTKGGIYETIFGDQSFLPRSTLEQYWIQHKNLEEPIFNLELLRIPPSSINVIAGDQQRTVLFAVTLNKLHYWSGMINFDPKFTAMVAQNAASALGADYSTFSDMFNESLNKYRIKEQRGANQRSSFTIYQPNLNTVARKFAMLTGIGIYTGNFDAAYLEPNSSSPSVTTHAKLIRMENCENILDIKLTEFHVILLLQDRIKAINVLDEALVYCQSVLTATRGDPVLGLCSDVVTNRTWLFTQSSLIELSVSNEKDHVWRIYLKNGDYEKAREFCLVSLRIHLTLSVERRQPQRSQHSRSRPLLRYGKVSFPPLFKYLGYLRVAYSKIMKPKFFITGKVGYRLVHSVICLPWSNFVDFFDRLREIEG
ncbi:Vacuolar protein sorting-associated protein 18 like protein [Cichlidogyrus casuarinus]|uniref:Vacuolar protein sorting-associated protein 18 like protein n=1 Tax=Cichlidogyrus casuarinus TaxID=1844966 RepID=A0ABD2Q916_9PLAT